jgi:hypothetical protein
VAKNLAAWQKTWQKPGSLAKNLAVSTFLQLVVMDMAIVKKSFGCIVSLT